MQQLLLGGAVGSLDSPADGELPPEDRHPFREWALLGRRSRSARRCRDLCVVWRLDFVRKQWQKTAEASAQLPWPQQRSRLQRPLDSDFSFTASKGAKLHLTSCLQLVHRSQNQIEQAS